MTGAGRWDGELHAGELAKATVDRIIALGLLPRLRAATVVQPDRQGRTQGVLDGDSEPVRLVSAVGVLAEAARVWVLITPPSGHHVIGWVGTPS